MINKNLLADSLTGSALRRALDATSSQQGVKLQPMLNDKQEAVAEPLVISNLRVDREKNHLKVQLLGDNKKLNTWARWTLFRLLTKHRNLLHESNSLAVQHTELAENKLTLTLEMPRLLDKVFNREFFRVDLNQQLVLPITLHLGSLNIVGTLEDFSAGGCRVALSPQLALHLIQPIDTPLLSTITFPNGEKLSSPIQMTYLQPQEDFKYALVGCHFLHESAEAEKEFVHHAFEIEREVARLSNVQRRVKHQSPLFVLPDKNLPKSAGFEDHLSSIAKMLMPLGYAAKIVALADQLALQALLLAMKKKLDPKQFKPLAVDFIEALEANTNAVQLALQQPNPAINPVVLHTLRVTSHCFPLAFKIGISSGLQLPVMMSLLLHDLGKLSVSHHPCFNPLKLKPSKLRLLKQHQIQLLRAAGDLHWIPPSLGESLMVNANERLDGSGYPRGLKQDRLDTLSRLVAVCKVLDCLVHGYSNPPKRWRDAYKWVHRRKDWFDFSMLRCFIKSYGLRPLNSRVLYSRGFLASVTQVGKQGEILEVMLLKSTKHPLEAIQGRRINTAAEFAKLGKIVSTLEPKKAKPV